MKSNFDEFISRKNTGSYKWDGMYREKPDVSDWTIPLSVADMEFRSPNCLYEKLSEYILTKPILGYTGQTDEFLQSVVNWNRKRHNWKIEKEWIVNTAGVVNAISASIAAFSNVNDGVIIFQPVYHPFVASIEKLHRTVINVPLINDNHHYYIDFDAFQEEAKKSENKILLFCSPHNPVGRVWTREELEKLSDICLKNNLIIISDEIWYDLICKGKKHIVFASINDEIAEKTIVCTAPSKTFNVAGLGFSNIIIKNKFLREQFLDYSKKMGVDHLSLIGFKACEILYNNCEQWLDEAIDVITSNQQFVKDFFKDNYPKIKTNNPEGTYVMWIDFNALNKNREELEQLLLDADIFPSKGHVFGEEGEGYERFNVAIPRKNLEYMLKNLVKYI